MVLNGHNKLFSNQELQDIDKLWNSSLLIKKEYSDRKYHSVNIPKQEANGVIEKLIDWFNLNSTKKVSVLPEELILHRFEKGNFFEKHTDNQVTRHGPRLFLVGTVLNDDFEGGEFITYNNSIIQVGKQKGFPYLMDSTILHEVKLVTKGIRKSAFVFLYKHNFNPILI